ncbi:MAG TPA: type II toxin-antitoxin system death-on-curing family toxin [Planctomycetales bacterium]|jgi:death-on-curing protein|nr:type II toxin-antitoxin system death-on-curing family toxin [Planctomycetales bacterium]
MLFPRKEEVFEIHRKLLEQFGGLPGIRDEGLLDSALLAAANRQHYEGADLAACAATYAFHLARNHPFVDGNKRVGAAVAEIFVRLNGAHLSASNDDIVAMFLDIAAGTVSREEVEQAFARWVITSPPSGSSAS